MISRMAINFPLSCPTNNNSCFTISVAEFLQEEEEEEEEEEEKEEEEEEEEV